MISSITANDLKTKGISCIEDLSDEQDETLITVHGKGKYVIMSIEKYNRLRELELISAVEETRAEYIAGKIYPDSIDEHIERIRDV